MSEYFSNFPKILYDIDGTGGRDPNYSTCQYVDTTKI